VKLAPACYGKIPVHGDFVRHGVSTAEIDDFDQWLQEGIVTSRQAVGAAWDAGFDATPPQRFLYKAKATGRILAGVLVPSKDKPGRRFPFAVFTAVDPKLFPGELTLLPAALGSFLDAAEERAVHGGRGGDLKSFLATVDALPVPADLEEGKKAILGFAARETNASFWTGRTGDPAEGRHCLLLHNLVETLKGGAAPRFVLRFPCSNGAAEVAFWLELCRRLSRRPGLPTLTVWGPGRAGTPAGLGLAFEELKAGYFLPLFWPERPGPLLFTLADGSGNGAPARIAQAKDRYGALVADPELRLSTLMVHLTPG
jgi:type VI secretion system protein ImpM